MGVLHRLGVLPRTPLLVFIVCCHQAKSGTGRKQIKATLLVPILVLVVHQINSIPAFR